jgi:hypothetical protein
MTAMIADPQHGYQRQVTQGDVDNLLTENAALRQQIDDMKNAQAQAQALAEAPPPAKAEAHAAHGSNKPAAKEA